MLMPMPLNPVTSPNTQLQNVPCFSPVYIHLHPRPLPSALISHIYKTPLHPYTSRIISMHSNRTSLPHNRLRLEESCAVDFRGGAAVGIEGKVGWGRIGGEG